MHFILNKDLWRKFVYSGNPENRTVIAPCYWKAGYAGLSEHLFATPSPNEADPRFTMYTATLRRRFHVGVATSSYIAVVAAFHFRRCLPLPSLLPLPSTKRIVRRLTFHFRRSAYERHTHARATSLSIISLTGFTGIAGMSVEV